MFAFDEVITFGGCAATVDADTSDAVEISGDADKRLFGLSLSAAITCS